MTEYIDLPQNSILVCKVYVGLLPPQKMESLFDFHKTALRRQLDEIGRNDVKIIVVPDTSTFVVIS